MNEEFLAKDLQNILLDNENGGYITANKNLIQAIGLNETIIYQELISKWVFYQEREYISDNEFYCTQDDLERSTGLSQTAQQTAIKKLKLLNLIDTQVKGIPKKTHFQILDTINPDNKDEHILVKYINCGKKIVDLMKEYNQVRVEYNKMKSNKENTNEIENKLIDIKTQIKNIKEQILKQENI
jgi:DNA-binding transcriptional regulator GbsR (MarR family)